MRSSAAPALALALLVVAVAAASAYATVGGGGTEDVTVPTLPPLEERDADLYDENGCLRVEADEVDCDTQAADMDEALADGVGTRHLAGYVGDHYADEVDDGDVVVLDETVSRASSGPFTASGLVRNERSLPVGQVEVTAALLDAAGAEMGVATGAAAVTPLRPGEPAPFALQSDVPAESVANVVWETSAAPVDEAATGSREIELTTYWEEPAGARQPVSLYFYADAAGPLPYLLFGGITNRAGADVGAPAVVAAWFDEAGHVVAVDAVDAVSPDGSPANELAQDGVSDFLFVEQLADGAPGVAVELWAAAP